MERDLRELVATVQNPHLRALLDALLGPGTPSVGALPRRPGGQVLPPGLPRTACSSTASPWPRRVERDRPPRSPAIDRDVAVTGALLHDIGKLEAYTADPRARST